MLQSITDQACQCPRCNWQGIVDACIPDVDGDGNLGCPNCETVITVTIPPNRKSSRYTKLGIVRHQKGESMWQFEFNYSLLMQPVTEVYVTTISQHRAKKKMP